MQHRPPTLNVLAPLLWQYIKAVVGWFIIQYWPRNSHNGKPYTKQAWENFFAPSWNRPGPAHCRKIEKKSVQKWSIQYFCNDVNKVELNIDNIVQVDFTFSTLISHCFNAYSVVIHKCDVIETSMRYLTKVFGRSFRRVYSVVTRQESKTEPFTAKNYVKMCKNVGIRHEESDSDIFYIFSKQWNTRRVTSGFSYLPATFFPDKHKYPKNHKTSYYIIFTSTSDTYFNLKVISDKSVPKSQGGKKSL